MPGRSHYAVLVKPWRWRMTWWYAACLRVLFPLLGALAWIASAILLAPLTLLVLMDPQRTDVSSVVEGALTAVFIAIVLYGAWRGLRVANRYVRFRA